MMQKPEEESPYLDSQDIPFPYIIYLIPDTVPQSNFRRLMADCAIIARTFIERTPVGERDQNIAPLYSEA